MRSRARIPWPTSLAGQFLALQLIVLLLVLVVTSVVSVRQSDADFRDSRGSRLRAAAEHIANTPFVQRTIDAPDPPRSLGLYIEGERIGADASAVYLAELDGTIVAGPEGQSVGDRIDLSSSDVQEGRGWTGDVTEREHRSIAAQVPVIRLVGPAGTEGSQAGGDRDGDRDLPVAAGTVPPDPSGLRHVRRIRTRPGHRWVPGCSRG